MDPHPVTSRRSVAGILRPGLGFLLAAAAALLLRSPLAAAPAEDPPPACIECHDDAAASFAEGSHRILPKSLRTDPAGTCALCHGPADPRHAESGGKEGVVGFSKIEPDAMAAACARCHTHHPDHVKDWKTSEYRENGLACAECHKVHEKSSAGIHLPVADAGRGVLGAESCRVCHVDVVEAAPASLHGKVMADPHLDSCEMCHAGGAKHVEAVRAPAAPAGAGFAKERTCLLCHSQMPERHRKELLPSVLKGFPSPLTAANCTSCHDPHLPKARTAAGLGLAAAP
ncbi:MAG: hypothetical protein HUU06_06655, partial [Planctomycetaceae bacterium]|nr:hypothetical protein [Planctomycetaceae bacterium]